MWIERITRETSDPIVYHIWGVFCFIVSVDLELMKIYEDDTRTTVEGSFFQANFISLQNSIHTDTYLQEQ